MVWSDAPPFPDTTSCTYGERYSNYICPTGYTPNSTVTNCTATPTKTCPAPCFTLNAATGRCDFTGGTNASCYTCPASTLNYSETSYQIYSTTVSGNQCPIKEPGVLNASPLSPSPWGNNSLFDGNTSVGLSYLLTKLGNVNNFTTRDGSVKCYPGKVCTNVTLTSGPSNGTAVTAGADCPAGYYCTSIDTAPIVCPLGSYCPAGAALPTACSAGSYCVEGSSSQTPCPAGYYCEKGNLKTPCLPGTYSASTGALSASTCLVCPAGSYCPSGSASATSCPVGNLCPMGTGSLNTCMAGYYCPTTTMQIRCPAGVTCEAGTSRNYNFVCDRTTIPTASYRSCAACPNPAAYYIWDPATATSSTEIAIPTGTDPTGAYLPVRFTNLTVNNFNLIAGKSILATSGGLKITGTVSSFTASELIVNVNGYSGTGTSNTPWTITPYGCDTVVKCQGHMKSSADFTKCEGCPLPAAGFIWAGSSGCETVQCTDGMFPVSDLTRCTNMRSTIATCTTNTQCAAGQTCGTNGLCTACAPGNGCATCPTSTPYWDGVECRAPPRGQYWNGTSFAACRICYGGTYETSACTSTSDRVCAQCTVCTAGSTYETRGCTATTNRTCSPCTACTSGSTYEIEACTVSRNRVCIPCTTTCPSGSYQSGACTITADTVCTAYLTSCPINQYLVSTFCSYCPRGTIKNTTGTSQSECITPTCPANKYLPSTILIDVAGTDTPSQYTSEAQCVDCPADTYKMTTGTSQSECRTCSAGQGVTNNTCTNCKAGLGCGCTGSTPYANGSGSCAECYGVAIGCSGGKTCTNGTCSCPATVPYFNGTTCVVCTQDSHCAAGQKCTNNQCITPTAVYSCPDTTVSMKCSDPAVTKSAALFTNVPVSLVGTICTTDRNRCVDPNRAVCKAGNVTGIFYTTADSVYGCSTPANVTYQ